MNVEESGGAVSRQQQTPALPRLSYLDNKVGSVSHCLKRLCCCSSTCYSATAKSHPHRNLLHSRTVARGEEPVKLMYMWSEWARRPHSARWLLIQVLGAKTEVTVGEWKIGISKILQRRNTLIKNPSLPQDCTGMDSGYRMFKCEFFNILGTQTLDWGGRLTKSKMCNEEK